MNVDTYTLYACKCEQICEKPQLVLLYKLHLAFQMSVYYAHKLVFKAARLQ